MAYLTRLFLCFFLWTLTNGFSPIQKRVTNVKWGEESLEMTGFYDYNTQDFNFTVKSLTTGCEVTLDSNQTQMNYAKLEGIKWDKHIFFIILTGIFEGKQTYFAQTYSAVKPSKESRNKFLPYQIASLWDTYLFSKHIDLTTLEVSQVEFEMTLSKNCTSPTKKTPTSFDFSMPLEVNDTKSTFVHNDAETNESSPSDDKMTSEEITRFQRNYTNFEKNSENTRDSRDKNVQPSFDDFKENILKLSTPLRVDEKNPTKEGAEDTDFTYDYYNEDALFSQSPVYIADHHTIMATLYSVMFEYLLWSLEAPHKYNKFKFDDNDIEICNIMIRDLVSEASTSPFSLKECCRIEMAQLKIFQDESGHSLKMRCHDPYLLTKAIQVAITAIGFVLTLLCPLMVKFIPRVTNWTKAPQQKPSENSRSHKNSFRNGHVRPCSIGTNLSNMSGDIMANHPGACRHPKNFNEGDSPESVPLTSEQHRKPVCRLKHRKTKSTPRPGLFQNVDDYIHLDSDPEFKLGIKVLLSRLFLYHIDNHVLSILRRLAGLLAVWSSINFAMFQLLLYFKQDLQVTMWVLFIPHKLYQLLDYVCNNYIDLKTDEAKFYTRFYGYVFLIPLVLTLCQFLLLFPISTRRQSLCYLLHSSQCKNHALRPENDASIREKVPPDNYCNNHSFGKYLYEDLLHHLSVLCNFTFLKDFWCNGPLKLPEYMEYDAKQPMSIKIPKILLLFFVCLLKIPLFIVLLLLYSLPAFSVWIVLLKEQHKVIPKKFEKVKSMKILIYFMLFIGICSTYAMVMNLICLYGQVLVFVFIDVIRNIRTMLPKVIFIVSIMVYIRNAFVRFEDDYRNLKAITFHICQAFMGETESSKKVRCRANPSLPLLQSDAKGNTFMPRFVFYEVCQAHMPYGHKVAQTVMQLCITLVCVSLLFTIVIDYQVLDQFSELGETFITVITVSLPSLFGMLKSEGHRALLQAKLHSNVQVTVQELIIIVEKNDESHREDFKTSGYKLTKQYSEIEMV